MDASQQGTRQSPDGDGSRLTRTRATFEARRRRARQLVHDFIARAGVDVVPMLSIRHSIGRRMKLLRSLGVEMVVDVGANGGQFGKELRDSGYRGQILSVEPLSTAYARLRSRAEADGRWQTVRCAVGASEGRATLHIAANSASSSILEMLPKHVRTAPASQFVGTEDVSVRRLDAIISEFVDGPVRTYLKVDVQGLELAVLAGAGDWMHSFVALQLEMSLAPLYANAPTAMEVDTYVRAAGYELAGVEPGFADPVSGRLLQLDGIYVRSNLSANL